MLWAERVQTAGADRVLDRGCGMITELRSPKPVEVQGEGPGLAFALLDWGPDEPIRFLIELKTGELVL
jgi:hypothetical protein